MSSDFKIAALCTTYFPASHADVIVSRWLEPAPQDAAYGWTPQTRIASLYVAQFPPDDRLLHTPKAQWRQQGFAPPYDLARATAREYNVPLYPSIRQALTLGGDKLAVDGVLLIAEHGDYPFNELGQHLYPRKEFFDEVVAVFRQSGRVTPIFVDKHLSWNMAWAQEMVQTARVLGIPLLAGSSLPYWMQLAEPLPPASQVVEGLALYNVGPEVYGFHSLEVLQAVVETRAGGESGIRAITTYREADVWEAMAQGAWSRDLFDAALAAVKDKKPGDPRVNCQARGDYAHYGCPVAFVFDHADGLRTTHILLEGHIHEYGLAIRTGTGRIIPSHHTWGGASEFYPHFARLNSQIQGMFLTGQPPVPIERTLLTTLAIATAMQALQTPGQRIATPQLEIAY